MSTKDAKIIANCIKGDKNAWNEFVERFSGLVMWCIKDRLSKSGYTFNNYDLQDIHQEVFLCIYKENKLAALKDHSKIAPWLSVVAGNIAMNKIKHIKGGNISEKSVPLPDILEDKTLSPVEIIDQAEREAIIAGAINCLKPREKIIINLYYANNNTIKEIASFLNMRQGSVASLVARARKKIKKNMHKNRN